MFALTADHLAVRDMAKSFAEGGTDGGEEFAFFGGDVAIECGEVAQKIVNVPLLLRGGKTGGELAGNVCGVVGVLDFAADAGDGGVEFAVTVVIGLKAHGAEELLDAGFLSAGEIAIHVHGEDEEVEQRLLLLGSEGADPEAVVEDWVVDVAEEVGSRALRLGAMFNF